MFTAIIINIHSLIYYTHVFTYVFYGISRQGQAEEQSTKTGFITILNKWCICSYHITLIYKVYLHNSIHIRVDCSVCKGVRGRCRGLEGYRRGVIRVGGDRGS